MESNSTYPGTAAVAAAIGAATIALFWWWWDSAWSLVFAPILAFWILGVYLRGKLNEAPLDQWEAVVAFLKGRS